MGLFGFIGEIAEATVKVVSTPIAVVKDTVKIIKGEEADSTSKLLESVGDNLSDSVDKLTDWM